jgi:uncharacterized damage-inducible protein DinB
MNLEELRQLVDYHYWSRDRMLDAAQALTPEQYARDLGSSFKSVRETVVHVYSAEWAWYSRWVGTSPSKPLSPAEFPDVESIRRAWKELEGNVRRFLDTLGEKDVDRVFDYKMFSGKESQSVFWHMLQHVVNHATYHRGQVTTLLRQLGAAPVSTDLIAFYRERAPKAK